MAVYEEGMITINYPPYGLVQLSAPINVDGSLIKEAEIVEIMNFLYYNMHNILQAQAKAGR